MQITPQGFGVRVRQDVVFGPGPFLHWMAEVEGNVGPPLPQVATSTICCS